MSVVYCLIIFRLLVATYFSCLSNNEDMKLMSDMSYLILAFI